MTTETLDQARERLRPSVEATQAATGWAFPVHACKLQQRNWDYGQRAGELLSQSRSVLDIGTGGGERFSAYRESYRGRAVASEGWHVNALLAFERLHPLGIDVVNCEDECMPFESASFDLVLNRHSALDPADVARILRPGGTLLTEQIWSHWRELKRYFPGMNEFPGVLTAYSSGLRKAGLEIMDWRTHSIPAAFDNLSDFVFMLTAANWTVPGIDPLGKDLETLLRLERDLTTQEGLVISDGAFLIEAHKPA